MIKNNIFNKILFIILFLFIVFFLFVYNTNNKSEYYRKQIESTFLETKEFTIKNQEIFSTVTNDLIELYNNNSYNYETAYNEYLTSNNIIHINERNLILLEENFIPNFEFDKDNNIIGCTYTLTKKIGKYIEVKYVVNYLIDMNSNMLRGEKISNNIYIYKIIIEY